MYVTVREKVEDTKTVTYTKKPQLTLMQCDTCNTRFHMVKRHSDHRPGIMSGIFDRATSDKGNMFDFHICSVACAQKLLDGHWKTLPKWAAFVQIEAVIQRATIEISAVLSEQQMLTAWDEYEQTESSGFVMIGGYSFIDILAKMVTHRD